MPTINKGSKVLVTGATGYIAAWVAQYLLKHGYAVRGTVRSQEKGEFLQGLFRAYKDKFEYIVVPDMTTIGAFDLAVSNVDAVAHTASPVLGTEGDEKSKGMVDVAVKGTNNIFSSILRHGSGVKRVIFLSSVAAVLEHDKDKDYDENDWNEICIAVYEKEGSKTNLVDKYRASKTLSERAAWGFFNEYKASVSWDLSVLSPPYVFGPVLHKVKSLESLNSTSKLWYDCLLNPDAFDNERLASSVPAYIDVRDLAKAHVLVLEKQAAGGERIIVSAGSFAWQDFVDAAQKLQPSPIPDRTIVKGNPGAGANAEHIMRFNTGKANRILELKYRSIEDTTFGALSLFQRSGI